MGGSRFGRPTLQHCIVAREDGARYRPVVVVSLYVHWTNCGFYLAAASAAVDGPTITVVAVVAAVLLLTTYCIVCNTHSRRYIGLSVVAAALVRLVLAYLPKYSHQ